LPPKQDQSEFPARTGESRRGGGKGKGTKGGDYDSDGEEITVPATKNYQRGGGRKAKKGGGLSRLKKKAPRKRKVVIQ